MINLPNVTLVIADCKNYAQALASLKKSLAQINPFQTLFLTDIDFDPKDVRIRVVKIDKISSLPEYSEFILNDLHEHISTTHVLVTQWDSWVLNADCWTDEFLNYDMVGAPWHYKDNRNVGNLGFGLLSYNLLWTVACDDTIDIFFPDDEVLGRLYRGYLESKYGIKYAPEDVAQRFSFELQEPTGHSFGFHGFHHQPFKEHVVIQREGAAGDIIMCEPILQYYHDKGYQVVLDTQPQFMSLFFQHPFSIKHISQMHPDIKPKEIIDLNMAYELKPKQLALQSYCEKAGIQMPMRNSRLNIHFDDKLFKKYAVIHFDSTGIPHRNINKLDWQNIVHYLEAQGYTVLQVGKRMDKEVATYFNTVTLEMLMLLLKGADLFIGLDSGNAQIAVALGVPSVIIAGSVNLMYRYTNFDNIIAIQGSCPKKETEFCYHETIGVTGTDCIYDKYLPPCTIFKSEEIIEGIKKLII